MGLFDTSLLNASLWKETAGGPFVNTDAAERVAPAGYENARFVRVQNNSDNVMFFTVVGDGDSVVCTANNGFMVPANGSTTAQVPHGRNSTPGAKINTFAVAAPSYNVLWGL
jgi:hypothetical protein